MRRKGVGDPHPLSLAEEEAKAAVCAPSPGKEKGIEYLRRHGAVDRIGLT